MRSVRLCRYADDGVIHCKSKKQARFVLKRLRQRLRACGLELHPQKTKLVYCKDINRLDNHEQIEFTFLGYSFRPRKAVDKYGRVYVNFSPAVYPSALKAMRQIHSGSVEDVQSGAPRLVAVLRAIPSLGHAPNRPARRSLSGSMAAAQVQALR